LLKVNRLKLAHNPEIWKPKTERQVAKKHPKRSVTRSDIEAEEEEIRARPLPLTKEIDRKTALIMKFYLIQI